MSEKRHEAALLACLSREKRGPLTSRKLDDGADEGYYEEPRKRESQKNPFPPHSFLDVQKPSFLP